MAHAALINDLGGQLFQSIVDKSQTPKAADKHAKNRILRGLRDQSASRTNQFEVSAKFEGLIEKFEVLNREDLAVALRSRVAALPNNSTWIPEVLSLFLNLSDRPAEKTKLEDVERPIESEQTSDASWKQILTESAAADSDLWQDVERGYHSSGDEGPAEDSDSDHTTSTEATSVREDSLEAIARRSLVQPDLHGVDLVKQAHSAQSSRDSSRRPSELLIIRDTLSMLQGLPSRLYEISETDSTVTVLKTAGLSTVSSSALQNLLSQCASIGSSINSLRRWTKTTQHLSYLQSFQAAIQRHIKHFNLDIAALEQKHCAAGIDALVVSIVQVRSEVEQVAQPLNNLSCVLRKALNDAERSFTFFDELYNEICIAQISSDNANLSVLVDVFHAGLRTYLRAVSVWISTGTMNASDSMFFVAGSNLAHKAGALWHERYSLQKDDKGRILAPIFMHALAPHIFAMGKSRALLRALDASNDVPARSLPFQPCVFDLAGLTPFSHTLAEDMKSWILATSSDCTQTLRSKVLHDCGLLRMQRELEEVFCSGNGAALQSFAEALFWRMDHDTRHWQNRFILSELAQNTLGTNLSANDGASLSIVIEADQWRTRQPGARGFVRELDTLRLNYTYPWALENITKSRTAASHAKILTLLLQVSRAKSLLSVIFLDNRSFQSGTEPLSNDVRAALKLRHSLLWFVNIFHAHIAEAAHVLGQTVRAELKEAKDIDGMAAVWTAYERKLESTTLVARNLMPIREAVIGILESCAVWRDEWDNAMSAWRDSHPSSSQRDDDENGVVVPAGKPGRQSRRRTSSDENLRKLTGQFGENLSFIVAGLRATGRAGGDATIEALAERLGWKAQYE